MKRDNGRRNVVYPRGKKLSVVAQTFFDHLRAEVATIQEELMTPARLRRSAAAKTSNRASRPRAGG